MSFEITPFGKFITGEALTVHLDNLSFTGILENFSEGVIILAVRDTGWTKYDSIKLDEVIAITRIKYSKPPPENPWTKK